MADDFDPDAYLGSGPGGGEGGFDPDAYLKGSEPAKSNMVEAEGMSSAIGAVKAGAKAFLNRYFQPSEVEKTGNIPVDVLQGGAEAALSRPFSAAQAGVAAGAEALGPTVDPLLKKFGLEPVGKLGKDVAGIMESEGVGGGRGMGAAVPHGTERGPAETARVLEKAARDAEGEPPGGGGAGPSQAPTFPPPTGPTPPEPAPARPVAQPRPGLEPNVRLLPPDLPVGQPVRDSVGAARATSALENASPEAVRILEDAARSEGWTEHTLDQLEEEQSPHHFLAESSPNFEQLTKSNQTLPGPARTEINQAVNQRHRERAERTNAIHNEYLGQDVDRTQWDATLRQAARQESSPFWRQFDQQVIQPTPEIDAVLQRPTMRKALAAANRTLLDRGQPIENGFPVLMEEEGGNSMRPEERAAAEQQLAETRVPTAKAFQLAKEHLDGLIADAVRSGRRGDVRTYTGLKHDLDAAIAAHPNADIARIWQQARQTYRGPMALINAREIGEGLLGSRTHYTEVPGLIEGMSPQERAAVQLGLRNHMSDVAGRTGATTELRNIREALGADNRRKIAAVIGPERAEAYFNALQQEEHMHFGPRRLTQGSDTAGNIAYQQLLQPPGTPTILSRAVDIAGKALHPKRAVAEAAMEAIRRGDDAAAGREAQRWQGVRADLGRLLTTQGPERDAIRRALVQRIQEGEGGLNGPVGRQPLIRPGGGPGTTRQNMKISQFERDVGEGREPTEPSAILEAGLKKTQEGPAPGETPPPERQAMSFGDTTRRNFLKGVAATGVAAAKPGPITSALKRIGTPERLIDIEAPRALARQAMYSFKEDKTKALDYLFDNAKSAKSGTPAAKTYEGAIRHITSGAIDKEPGIWAKSVAELRAHDEQVRAAQAARNVAEQASSGTGEEPVRGRGELSGGERQLEAPRGADSEAREPEAPLTVPTQKGDRVSVDEAYPRASGEVDGLKVRKDVPNTASIGAELGNEGNYEELPGIREVQFSAFSGPSKPTARTQALGEAIKSSGEINPLIVAIDAKGPYILEGANRFDALQHIGKKTFPAVVVVDNSARAEPPLTGLPTKVTVPGIGKIEVGPHQPIRDLARQYMADAGLPYNPPKDYTKVDPIRARRIADEYEKMPHAPDDPEVKAAYKAMADETMAQWNAIKKSGFKAEFIPPGSPDPYAASPRLAVEDIKKNNHMWVFSTRDGFGTLESFDPSTNPLLADTGEVISGQPALVNDIFRIVHDYFGHAKEGVGFRADGEENAWRSHAAMYSPLARKAMTSETRGQNSWLNYGPYGDANRTAKTEGTVFADQKTGVMPDWVVNEGSGQAERKPLLRSASARDASGRPTRTAPIPSGREADVLRAGYNTATGEHPARIGQRLVTSKKAEPSPENTTVDIAAAKQSPESYQNNVDLLRHLLPYKQSKLVNLDKVASAFVDQASDNLKWLWNQVEPDVRDRSRIWYEGGRNIVDNWVKDYGVKDSTAAAVIAAMSPQKDWFQNVSLAHRVLEINKGEVKDYSPKMREAFDARPSLQKYKPMMDDIDGKNLGDIDEMDVPADVRTGLKALWTRLYDEANHSPEHHIITPEGGASGLARVASTGEPAAAGWGSLAEIGKAIRAIETNGNPAELNTLLGEKHKVRNFYNNLLSPNSKLGDVTIDTHAVAAALLRPLGGNSLEVSHNFANYPGKDLPAAGGSASTGVQGTYPFYADAYRKAAKELGVLPRELQSVTWEAVRGLFPAASKKGMREGIDNIWRQYRNGKVSLDEARQQVLKVAGAEKGIPPPDWYGRGGGSAEALQGAADETELPRSGASWKAPKEARRRGEDEPAARASGGRVEPPLSARKKYHYHPDRGTNAEHCGNCSMFRKPHGCTAVGGFIASFGKCDIWDARAHRAEGGSTFEERAERSAPASTNVENRLNDPPMTSTESEMRRLRSSLTDQLFPRGQPTMHREAGRMSSDAGANDIGRLHRQVGGGTPWQTLMQNPWAQSALWPSMLRSRTGIFSPSGMGQGSVAIPGALGQPAGTSIAVPPSAPASMPQSSTLGQAQPPAVNQGSPAAIASGQTQPLGAVSAPAPVNAGISVPAPSASPSPLSLSLSGSPMGQPGGATAASTQPMTGMSILGSPDAQQPTLSTAAAPQSGGQLGMLAARARGGKVEPTDAQKEAGNYEKRHIRIHGLDVSIENERGSTRSGVGRDGKRWSVRMPYHYGYIRRTEGADGDHVDVCLGPHPRSPHVFVVDQVDADSKRWDEHKVLIGFGSAAQARAYYKRGFSDGKGHQRLGHMTEMTVERFKEWLKGDTTKPAARAA